MLVYANRLIFQGNGSENAVFKAIGSWLKEQLGFGLHPKQLKQDGDFSGFRVNPVTDSRVPSWLRIYAAVEGELQLYAWILKNDDDSTFGRQWVTELGLKRNPDGIELSCVVRTEESSTLVTAPVSASRPRVIKYVAGNIERASDAHFAPETEGVSVKTVGLEVDSYRSLMIEIERPDRKCPIILLGPTVTGDYHVDGDLLQRDLFGLAQIVRIDPDFDRYEMENILGRRWSAWNGSINILNAPNRSGFVRTRYFLEDEILDWGRTQHDRTANILAWVTNSTNLHQLRQRIRPEGVMQLAIRRRLQIIRDRSTQMGAEELRQQIESLTKDQTEQATLQKMFEEDNAKLEAENEDIKKRLEDLDYKLREERHKNSALRVSWQKNKSGVSDSGDVRSILELACRVDEPEPRESLNTIELIYGDACTVLESAKDSADDLNNFTYGRRLLDMLRRLVTEYRDQLIKGGDNQARTVFGKNEFSAKESETVMNNPKMKKARTFSYDGKDVEMFRHLKIGVDDNVEKTIRVHFHWDTDKQKIVIGYCGKHLPISGH